MILSARVHSRCILGDASGRIQMASPGTENPGCSYLSLRPLQRKEGFDFGRRK